LIEQIENIKANTPNEALLQNQMQLLLESLLVELTVTLLSYQRSSESIEESLRNYLAEKGFDIKKYKVMLSDIKKNEKRNISDLSVIVNHFLLIRA
jgi:hypothetical protein